MSAFQLAAKQHLSHGQFGYMVMDEHSGRMLGGFGANYYRPWVFPLYTPEGVTVLQEFPYDHPFHNGLWVAQGPLRFADLDVHFWPAPPMRKANEQLFAHMGRMECAEAPQIEQHRGGLRFTLPVIWRDKDENPILDEVRTVVFYGTADATICDMWSAKTATYGTVVYEQSKFGSVGIRVEPRLLPQFGGTVIADGGRRGTADIAIDQRCQFVAYENEIPGQKRSGVMMTILGDTDNAQGPWFVRDYGMAMYNANRNQSITSEKGQTWTVGLRVVAYHEPLTDERAFTWLELL